MNAELIEYQPWMGLIAIGILGVILWALADGHLHWPGTSPRKSPDTSADAFWAAASDLLLPVFYLVFYLALFVGGLAALLWLIKTLWVWV